MTSFEQTVQPFHSSSADPFGQSGGRNHQWMLQADQFTPLEEETYGQPDCSESQAQGPELLEVDVEPMMYNPELDPALMDEQASMSSDPASQHTANAQPSVNGEPGPTTPEKVVIITPEYELEAYVHVEQNAPESRRLSQLMNDPSRRFLALTQVTAKSRIQNTAPREFRFLKVNLASVLLMHPFIQSTGYLPTKKEHNNEKQGKTAYSVTMTTADVEVTGQIFTSRNHKTKNTDRRLSEALNDPNRRFVAVTEARLVYRHMETPMARYYGFVLLQLNAIDMVCPDGVDMGDLEDMMEQSRKLEGLKQKLADKTELKPIDAQQQAICSPPAFQEPEEYLPPDIVT